MRKKLFAVIMSAMMMVTFMPAMAFAFGPTPVGPTKTGWYVDGVFKAYYHGSDRTDTGVYDGKEHKVEFYCNPEDQEPSTVQYYHIYNVGTKVWTKNATSVALKDAGTYRVYMVGSYWTPQGSGALDDEFTLTITPRPVAVKGFVQAYKLTKAYDGKGFSLTDKDFTISQTKDGNGKLVAASGLVEGDTLLLKPFTTKADVGVYPVKLQTASRYDWINPNYTVDFWDNGKELCAVEITKAENAVTLSKTNKTYKAKALKNGKKSFNINPKATWGDVKVTKVGGSGYLYLNGNKVVVKKGAKVGTYKLKVKAYVVGTNNWNSAELIKTINVKVK